MSKKKKAALTVISIIALIAVGVGMWFIYQYSKDAPEKGEKSVTIKIISERDNYNFEQQYRTNENYLGDFLEKNDLISFDTSEFGRFITGAKGFMANDAEQSWWNVLENGNSVLTGIDEIALKDGAVYTLQLVIGW